MSTLDMEALKTVVAEGRRTAGTIAASAEMLSWRNRFRETEETDELVRVLYEDVPLVLRAQSRTERFLRQIDVSAGRGVGREQLEKAAAQLRETSSVVRLAMDDVLSDLQKLEELAC